MIVKDPSGTPNTWIIIPLLTTVSKLQSLKVTLKAVGKTDTFLTAAKNFFYWPISSGTAGMKNELVPKCV